MGPGRGERGAADPGGWQRTRRRLKKAAGRPRLQHKGQQAIGRAAGEVSRGPGWLEAAANGARACRHGRVWSRGVHARRVGVLLPLGMGWQGSCSDIVQPAPGLGLAG